MTKNPVRHKRRQHGHAFAWCGAIMTFGEKVAYKWKDCTCNLCWSTAKRAPKMKGSV